MEWQPFSRQPCSIDLGRHVLLLLLIMLILVSSVELFFKTINADMIRVVNYDALYHENDFSLVFCFFLESKNMLIVVNMKLLIWHAYQVRSC